MALGMHSQRCLFHVNTYQISHTPLPFFGGETIRLDSTPPLLATNLHPMQQLQLNNTSPNFIGNQP